MIIDEIIEKLVLVGLSAASLTEALTEVCKELNQFKYKEERGIEVPQDVEWYYCIPLLNYTDDCTDKCIGITLMGKYRDYRGVFFSKVVDDYQFSQKELERIEAAWEELQVAEKKTTEPEGCPKPCAFLTTPAKFGLSVKPDYCKMIEVPISKRIVELVRHQRTGLEDLYLFLSGRQQDGVIVYVTDRGTYLIPFSGYQGRPWTAELIDHLASPPVVTDGVWLGTFSIKNAKVVAPEDFFLTYDSCVEKVAR